MAWTERYVSVAGGGAHDGTSEANAWTLAEAVAGTGATGGHRVNVKAGTYGPAAVTFGAGGGAATTTSPKWWRGYKTTIGDMDSEPTSTRTAATDIPSITLGANAATISSPYQTFSNIDFTSSNAGPTINCTSTHLKFYRCRAENTAAASGNYAIRMNNNNGIVLARCWFKATSSASYVIVSEERQVIWGCAVRGGITGILANGGDLSLIAFCVIDDPATNYGIEIQSGAGGRHLIINNTIYAPGSDGIRISSSMPAVAIIAGNIIANCGGYGINNSSGTNTGNIFRACNTFYSNSSGNENGFGDVPSFSDQTESGSPFENAGSHDFDLTTGVNALNNALPGLFENEAYRAYLDCGAVDHVDPAGGSGGVGALVAGGLVVS